MVLLADSWMYPVHRRYMMQPSIGTVALASNSSKGWDINGKKVGRAHLKCAISMVSGGMNAVMGQVKR
jgi:hypothetical protein